MTMLFCELKTGQMFMDKGRTYTKIDESTGATIHQHVKFFTDKYIVTIPD